MRRIPSTCRPAWVQTCSSRPRGGDFSANRRRLSLWQLALMPSTCFPLKRMPWFSRAICQGVTGAAVSTTNSCSIRLASSTRRRATRQSCVRTRGRWPMVSSPSGHRQARQMLLQGPDAGVIGRAAVFRQQQGKDQRTVGTRGRTGRQPRRFVEQDRHRMDRRRDCARRQGNDLLRRNPHPWLFARLPVDAYPASLYILLGLAARAARQLRQAPRQPHRLAHAAASGASSDKRASSR